MTLDHLVINVLAPVGHKCATLFNADDSASAPLNSRSNSRARRTVTIGAPLAIVISCANRTVPCGTSAALRIWRSTSKPKPAQLVVVDLISSFLILASRSGKQH